MVYFQPKIQIWVNFGGPLIEKCWYILCSLGIFDSNFGYFMTILCSFGTFFRFWYHVPRKIWQPWAWERIKFWKFCICAISRKLERHKRLKFNDFVNAKFRLDKPLDDGRAGWPDECLKKNPPKSVIQTIYLSKLLSVIRGNEVQTLRLYFWKICPK
jgi:hypothetical protein